MSSNVFSDTFLRDETMPRTPQKVTDWKDRLNGWAQVATIVAVICAIGLPLLGYMKDSEHRLTKIEENSAVQAASGQQAVKASAQAVDNSNLALRVALFQLQMMSALRLSKDDKKKRNDLMSEIQRRKISEAGSYAGGDVERDWNN